MNSYFITDAATDRIILCVGPRLTPPLVLPGQAAVVTTEDHLSGWPTAPHPRFEWRAGGDGVSYWHDPRTLSEAQTEAVDAMRDARDAALYGGFTWDGSEFDSDERTQSVISGMAFATTQPDWVDEYFRLADNSWRLLTATDTIALWVAMKTHIRACFGQFAVREAAINAAATKAEVDAIVW